MWLRTRSVRLTRGTQSARCSRGSPSVLFAPGKQGVVDRQLSSELLLIVVERQAEALRDRNQPTGLRREVALIRIGAPHNERESVQRWLFFHESEVTDDGVEGALLAMVAELGAWNVVWRRSFALGDGRDLVGSYVQELGLGIDEPFDKPWTRDSRPSAVHE